MRNGDALLTAIVNMACSIAGIPNSVSFQPAVGGIISDRWELTNKEFGEGMLAMNQFLLEPACTKGAVVRTANQREREPRMGWMGRDGLMRHIGDVGAETIARTSRLHDD